MKCGQVHVRTQKASARRAGMEWNELVKSARVTMKAQAKTISYLQNTIKFKMKPKPVLEMLSDCGAGPVGKKQ